MLFRSFNIIVYSFVTFVFIFSYTNIKTLEIGLLDIRTLKLMQDFYLISLILESLCLIIVGIRATGFNIRKFDFDQDLEDLKITAEDNEEFEIDVELDTDQLKRNLRKKIRHAKYIYIENHTMIHIGILIFIACIGCIIYLNTGVYHKRYQEGTYLSTSEFIINVKNSYITTQNYHGYEITKNKKLLVIQYQTRTINPVNKKMFRPERFYITIGKKKYYDTDSYKDELYDFGNRYHQEYLKTSFQEYILIYEIPTNSNTDKIVLNYRDINDKTIEVLLTPKYDNEPIVSSFSLGDTVSLQKSLFNQSSILFQSYELNETFTNNYTYCVQYDCMDAIEYMRPSVSGNYPKTLLKLVGEFHLDPDSTITKLNNFYTLLKDFGTITYEINGETKMISRFQQVKPTKGKVENTYYIEVPKELETAEHITISFKIREFIYKFVVK